MKILPYPEIVSECFKFFKPENRIVRLDLPSLYDFEKLPTDKPFFYVNYDKAYLHYVDQNRRTEVRKNSWISIKTPKAGNIKRFHLLCYNDIFKTEVLGNWLIECYSMCTIDVLTPMGYETVKKLNVFSDTSRSVMYYSSHPLLAYFGTPYNSAFPLNSGNT